MSTDPYLSHAAANTAIDAAIRNEAVAGGISPADVSDAVEKSAAMVGAIVKATAAGAVTYYAPASRTGSDADNASWWSELETLLEGASNGDTYTLPPVVFEPSDTSVIEITATDITINGYGAKLKRGANTPVASTSSGLFGNTQAGENLVVRGVVFDGDGTALSATADPADVGNTVFTRADATFVDCRFDDPLETSESYSLRHDPGNYSPAMLRLIGCVFNDSGQGCWRVLNGSVIMIGGAMNIATDRNGTGSGNPYQRFFQVSGNTGGRPRTAVIDGVSFYCVEPTATDANIGYFNFGADDTADDLDGLNAAVTDDGTTQNIVPTTQPTARGGASGASACRVSVTTAAGTATAGDIKDIACIITGTDENGDALVETLQETKRNEASTVYSQNYFKTITDWELPPHDATGVTTSLGYVVPQIERATLRNCNFEYEVLKRSNADNLAKIESVEHMLLDGVTVTTRQDSSTYVMLSTDNECGTVEINNCTLPVFIRHIGQNQGTCENLIIRNSRIGVDGKGSIDAFITNAENYHHILIENSRFSGAGTGSAGYFVKNTAASSYWGDYDADATVTFRNVEYLFWDGNTTHFICLDVPRLGFFAGVGLKSLNAHDPPGATVALGGGAWLSNSSEERLLATVHPDNRRMAFLGRRLDAPDVIATLGSATNADYHPFAVAVADTDDTAFTGITGTEATEGDIIWNDYGGKNDISGPTDSDVLAWRYSSTGKWWPILAATTDPPAPP